MLPSDSLHWFRENLVETWCLFQIGTVIYSVTVDMFLLHTYLWMHWLGAGYAWCHSTWGQIRRLQRVNCAVTGLTGHVCFHAASHDWTVIDHQPINHRGSPPAHHPDHLILWNCDCFSTCQLFVLVVCGSVLSQSTHLLSTSTTKKTWYHINDVNGCFTWPLLLTIRQNTRGISGISVVVWGIYS